MFLTFWSNALAIPKHNICTHENKHQIPVMRDGLQGRSYFEELDSLGTVLLVGVGGLRELSIVGSFMVDGLVEVEKWKGSGMTTGILEAGSTGTQTLPMASNKVLSEILIPS